MLNSAKTSVTEERSYEFSNEEFLAALNIPATFKVEYLDTKRTGVVIMVSRSGQNVQNENSRSNTSDILAVAALDEDYWTAD